jgi:hypothetical protein
MKFSRDAEGGSATDAEREGKDELRNATKSTKMDLEQKETK